MMKTILLMMLFLSSLTFAASNCDYKCEAYSPAGEGVCRGLDYYACTSNSRTCYVVKDCSSFSKESCRSFDYTSRTFCEDLNHSSCQTNGNICYWGK